MIVTRSDLRDSRSSTGSNGHHDADHSARELNSRSVYHMSALDTPEQRKAVIGGSLGAIALVGFGLVAIACWRRNGYAYRGRQEQQGGSTSIPMAPRTLARDHSTNDMDA